MPNILCFSSRNSNSHHWKLRGKRAKPSVKRGSQQLLRGFSFVLVYSYLHFHLGYIRLYMYKSGGLGYTCVNLVNWTLYFFLLFSLLCVQVLCLNVCQCAACTVCVEARGGYRNPWNCSCRWCDPPWECWEVNPDHLEVLSIVDPALYFLFRKVRTRWGVPAAQTWPVFNPWKPT